MMRRLGLSDIIILAIIITAVAIAAITFITLGRGLLRDSIMHYELSKSWVVAQYLPYGVLKIVNIGENYVVLKDVYLISENGVERHVFNGHKGIRPGDFVKIPLNELRPRRIVIRICLPQGGYCKVLKYEIERYEITAYSKGGGGVGKGQPPKGKLIVVNKTLIKNAIMIFINDQYHVKNWLVRWIVRTNSRIPGAWFVNTGVEYLNTLRGFKKGTGRWIGVIRLPNSSYPVSYTVMAVLKGEYPFLDKHDIEGGIGRPAPMVGAWRYTICAILPHKVEGSLRNAGEGVFIEFDVLCTEQPLINVEYHGDAPLLILAFFSIGEANFIIPVKAVRNFLNETITLSDVLARLFSHWAVYHDEFYIGPDVPYFTRPGGSGWGISLGLILAIPRNAEVERLDVKFVDGVKGDWAVSTEINDILKYASVWYPTLDVMYRLRPDLRAILLSGAFKLIAVYVKVDLNDIDGLARLVTLKGPAIRVRLYVRGGPKAVWIYGYNVNTLVVRGTGPYRAFVLLTPKGRERFVSSIDYPWLNGGIGVIHELYTPLEDLGGKGKPSYYLGRFMRLKPMFCSLALCNNSYCVDLPMRGLESYEWFGVHVYALVTRNGILELERLAHVESRRGRTVCTEARLTYDIPENAVLVYISVRLHGGGGFAYGYFIRGGVVCRLVKEVVLDKHVTYIMIKGRPMIYAAWFDRDGRKVMYAELKGSKWYAVIKIRVKRVFKCDDGRTYENIETRTKTKDLGTVDLTYALGLGGIG